MSWVYEGRNITSLDNVPEGAIGFIYVITNNVYNHENYGKIYVGKKVLHNTNKKKITKKEKLETGTRKKTKKVTKESNWFFYTGSCKELNDDIKEHGLDNFSRQILRFCKTKKYLTFSELEYQFKFDVLYEDTYNGNIASRYYKRDMEQ